MTKKYAIGNWVVPPEERDRFKALSKTGAYRNLRAASPEVGDAGTYTIELTEREASDLAENPPSNLRYIEEVPPDPDPPCVDNQVPADIDLRGAKADKLFEWGFTGRGIDVGVIDTGLGSGVASKFNIKNIRSEANDSPYQGEHGSNVASVAVPRASRLVFSRAIDEPGQTSTLDGFSWVQALYWMVDTVGVHIVNMSFGSIRTSYQTEIDAVAHARSKGVVLVAAAGNNDQYTTSYYPATYAGIIGVGALNRLAGWSRATKAQRGDWGSNWGPHVDVWANGVDVITYGPTGALTDKDGTSLASPLVVYTKAALLTKGLKSIGELNVQQAVKKGDGKVPKEGGGGGATTGGGQEYEPPLGLPPGITGSRLNAEGAAWAMRDYCG